MADFTDDNQPTFRDRFNALPNGRFSVMRRSTNIEDDRGRSLPSKLSEDLVNVWNKSLLRGGLQEVGVLPPDDPLASPAPPTPETTDDPLATQAGYNSIKVQKVIHPSWWSPTVTRPSRFAGGQLGSQEMNDRMEDIHSEVDPTRSDLDRTMDPLVDRFNQGVPPRNVPAENNANIDPIARPPGTVERYEDIDD